MKCEECKYFSKPGWDEVLTQSELEQYQSEEQRLAYVEHVYEVGECCRFPPFEPPEGDDYGYSHPDVFRDDWCGEFEAKDIPVELDAGLPDWLNMCWSVRCRNAMEKAGISSVADLLMKRQYELLRLKNFGVTALQEVLRKLGDYNLALKP